MSGDHKNLILAIALSFLILIGWQYFFADELSPPVQETTQTQPVNPTSDPAVPVPQSATAGQVPSQPGAPATPVSREQAVAANPRVIIDTPAIKGSFSLIGGRIDDVALRHYRETVNPDSPIIVLLSPPSSPEPYYADFGWVAADGRTVALPTPTTEWTADSDRLTPAAPVTLTWDNGEGLVFRRVIAVDDDAMFTVTDSVENATGEALTLHPWSLVTRRGTPKTENFYLLHEGMIGVLGSEGLREISFASMAEEPKLATGGTGVEFANTVGGFIGITEKYWATALIPNQETPFAGRFSLRTGANGQPIYQADVLGPAKALEPGGRIENRMHLFAGAKEVSAISHYETTLGIKNFDLLIDWGWFYFITKPMFLLLDFFYRLIGNFGVAILVVTVLVKLAFLPLANRSYASMAKMKAVQPEMVAIRERYKEDRAKQQQALMELYKKEKINPIAGCWPMLVQIPVFFALYKVLFITIEMRHAPFFGWIKDLSAPDPLPVLTLFGLIPWDPAQVPLLGPFLMIGVWPVIMGFTMFIQMKMNPAPPDPIQQTMFTWMPIIFTFMLASFPAGLVIYWSWNNLLSVIQQGYIMHKNGVKIELWGNLRNMFRKKQPKKG
ncbi:membrane protein insertase YidC [Pseudochelatococcus contaminans]|uniref:Membrane protein insertase YidC n=1 Tax=Pseudochelatococcus contaminans TaxID=1538103 RepID=A0A7W6EFA8_9HYPH|nr:membrane protein insertase YidC [Pseudochelatococcus contaminans]MBB3808713.1 YidC/Oxa1 family membrane protein insertase [Pseudochelatococcus contaminans]